jgi:predicted O-methyltransferase YrrM
MPSCRSKLARLGTPAFSAALLLAGLTLALQGGVAGGAQESKPVDVQAKERLDWMREHQPGMWNVAPREGVFLHDLIVKVRAKHALEIGTSNGYSGIWIAAGLRETGGHLLTLEIHPGRAQLAQENFRAAGVENIVTLKLCDALEEIPHLQGPFDFVFIDAWKRDYVKYLHMVLPMVPAGGVIVAHNVTDLRDQLQDFIHEVQTNPQLKTSIENPGPGGFSVSYKRAAK